jgi:hypothetical protein
VYVSVNMVRDVSMYVILNKYGAVHLLMKIGILMIVINCKVYFLICVANDGANNTSVHPMPTLGKATTANRMWSSVSSRCSAGVASDLILP